MSKIKRDLPLNGAAWQRLRASVLAEQPLCRMCSLITGSVTPATEVDHIDNNPNNNDRDNLDSLCKPCHSRKTNQDMGHSVNWGSDLNGMPVDPKHPWNTEKSQNSFLPRPTSPPSFNPKS